jgi:hypothetical protein
LKQIDPPVPEIKEELLLSLSPRINSSKRLPLKTPDSPQIVGSPRRTTIINIQNLSQLADENERHDYSFSGANPRQPTIKKSSASQSLTDSQKSSVKQLEI